LNRLRHIRIISFSPDGLFGFLPDSYRYSSQCQTPASSFGKTQLSAFSQVAHRPLRFSECVFPRLGDFSISAALDVAGTPLLVNSSQNMTGCLEPRTNVHRARLSQEAQIPSYPPLGVVTFFFFAVCDRTTLSIRSPFHSGFLMIFLSKQSLCHLCFCGEGLIVVFFRVSKDQ
jgi:hypothetical protein